MSQDARAEALSAEEAHSLVSPLLERLNATPSEPPTSAHGATLALAAAWEDDMRWTWCRFRLWRDGSHDTTLIVPGSPGQLSLATHFPSVIIHGCRIQARLDLAALATP